MCEPVKTFVQFGAGNIGRSFLGQLFSQAGYQVIFIDIDTAVINALNEFLIDETRQGHNVVLIIDESQNLKPSQLEQIRLLSNLETEKEKLLQIILVQTTECLDI